MQSADATNARLRPLSKMSLRFHSNGRQTQSKTWKETSQVSDQERLHTLPTMTTQIVTDTSTPPRISSTTSPRTRSTRLSQTANAATRTTPTPTLETQRL